jgi:hypothetical protein
MGLSYRMSAENDPSFCHKLIAPYKDEMIHSSEPRATVKPEGGDQG